MPYSALGKRRLVILAAIMLSVPALFGAQIEPDFEKVEYLSLATAAVILILYVLFIVYSFRQPETEIGFFFLPSAI